MCYCLSKVWCVTVYMEIYFISFQSKAPLVLTVCLDFVLSCSACFRLSSGSGSRPLHPHSFSLSLHHWSTDGPSYVQFTYFVAKPVNKNEFHFFGHDLRDGTWHKSTEKPSFVIFKAETDQSWSQNWTLMVLMVLQSLIRPPPCVCLMKCIQSRNVMMFSDFWINSFLSPHQKHTDKEV